VGHHGGRGTTAAAMVHRVLLIDMCLVLDLCVGMVLTYRRSTLLLDNLVYSHFLIFVACTKILEYGTYHPRQYIIATWRSPYLRIGL
jgi:hypothetical protein